MLWRWIAAPSVLLALSMAPLASALTVGFETAEGYTLGPLSPSGSTAQASWSGGAQGGFTNNDAGDEQIVDTHAHSGLHSWHYARGYGSAGQGTPFSPTLPSVAGPGTRFDFSIHFRAADASGDDSQQSLYMGTAAGTDRTGFNVYLSNSSGGDGLHLYSYDWIGGTSVKQVFATGLDRNTWHELQVTATFAANPANDLFEYSVDGTPYYSGNSWINPWRVSMGFEVVYGNNIKLADEGGDVLAHQGFYYDDLVYSHAPAVPVPSLGPVGLGALILILAGAPALAGRRLGRRHQRR